MNKEKLISNLMESGYNKKIISAFKKVPRENFISKNLKDFAYEDTALPLEKGATISQPSTVAFMIQILELKPKQKILEIGSGCGYVLALISQITKSEIHGIEIIPSLARKSKKHLKNYKKIKIHIKNGLQGLPAKAPFDRILISASAENLPEHLFSQLSNNGILVVPVKNSILQIKKISSSLKIKEFPGFVFVPLISERQH